MRGSSQNLPTTVEVKEAIVRETDREEVFGSKDEYRKSREVAEPTSRQEAL